MRRKTAPAPVSAVFSVSVIGRRIHGARAAHKWVGDRQVGLHLRHWDEAGKVFGTGDGRGVTVSTSGASLARWCTTDAETRIASSTRPAPIRGAPITPISTENSARGDRARVLARFRLPGELELELRDGGRYT